MMRPVRLKRGFNNEFYFVEHNSNSGQDMIKELKIETKNKVTEFNVRTVHEMISGSVIAMEMDYGDGKEIDIGVLSDGNFGERYV